MSPARTTKVRMAAQNHRIVHQSPAYPRTKPVIRIHQKPRIITRYDERENSRRAATRSRFRSFASRNPTPEETPWAIRNTNTPKMCTNTIQSYTTGSSAMRTSPRVSEKALNMPDVVDVHAQCGRLLSEIGELEEGGHPFAVPFLREPESHAGRDAVGDQEHEHAEDVHEHDSIVHHGVERHANLPAGIRKGP